MIAHQRLEQRGGSGPVRTHVAPVRGTLPDNGPQTTGDRGHRPRRSQVGGQPQQVLDVEAPRVRSLAQTAQQIGVPGTSRLGQVAHPILMKVPLGGRGRRTGARTAEAQARSTVEIGSPSNEPISARK